MAEQYDGTQKASLLDLMPSSLRNKQTWADMMDVFARVIEINVEGPIEQLEAIRSVNAQTDTGVLNNTARLLGFDLSQDVLNLNADNLTKVVSQLSLYPDQNGTKLFVKFVDLVLNSVTELEYLWTKDYVNFYPVPGGATIKENGPWFKTTHIRLNLALQSLDTLTLDAGMTLHKRTLDLFSSFAPVALVIETMDFVIRFDDKDWLGGSAFGIGAAIPYTEATVIID